MRMVNVCSGEACWWTVHPASKQRSEGEKVRVGDDLILVSVATERYLVICSYGSCHIDFLFIFSYNYLSLIFILSTCNFVKIYLVYLI